MLDYFAASCGFCKKAQAATDLTDWKSCTFCALFSAPERHVQQQNTQPFFAEKRALGILKIERGNSMNFVEAMKNQILEDYNESVTENGAIGYRTTGKALLDLNFSVASLRSSSEETIIRKFVNAFREDQIAAVKWLFYARDVRGGLGERRLFRTAMKFLAQLDAGMAKKLIPLIPEYGRFDDLFCLLDIDGLVEPVCEYLGKQLDVDVDACGRNQPISLLAKWLPSENASSPETNRLAKIIRKNLRLTSKEYRQILTYLRNYLNIVETKMSAKQWTEIDYEAVPSRANLIYNSAFLRNDEDRRREYLGKLEKGEAKINAGVLYPHDIVHTYCHGGWRGLSKYDAGIEALWKALPNTVDGCGNTIVVADGSGSMQCPVGKSGVTALEVANALAIYFAERSSGQFKDKYITFSMRPQLVNLAVRDGSLYNKLAIALQHSECANTNIEAVFDLILDTALRNNMRQEDIPANVLIISDMEFDGCAMAGAYNPNRWDGGGQRVNKALFKMIAEKYKNAGYKLPRLVFWNVNSRTGTIPVRENEMGVALVSGFSVNICKMVMSDKLDPFECLMDAINTERYQPIEDILKA